MLLSPVTSPVETAIFIALVTVAIALTLARYRQTMPQAARE